MNNKKPNRKLKNYKENKNKSISKRKLKGGHLLQSDVLEIYVLFFVTMLLRPYISFMKSWCNYYFQLPIIQEYLRAYNLLSYFQSSQNGSLQFNNFNAISNFIKLFYFDFDTLYDNIISSYNTTINITTTKTSTANDNYMNRYSENVHDTLVHVLEIINPSDPSLNTMYTHLEIIYSTSLNIEGIITVQVIKKYLLQLKQKSKTYILYTRDSSYNKQLYFIYGLHCFAAFNYELFETMKKFLVNYNPTISYPDILSSRNYDNLLDIEFYDYFNYQFDRRPTFKRELKKYFTGTDITIGNRRKIVESLLNIDNEISSIRMIIRSYPESNIVRIVAEYINDYKSRLLIEDVHSVAKTRYQELLAKVNKIIDEKKRVSDDLIAVNKILEEREKYHDKLKQLNEKKQK